MIRIITQKRLDRILAKRDEELTRHITEKIRHQQPWADYWADYDQRKPRIMRSVKRTDPNNVIDIGSKKE